jgi:inner membrane protein
MDNISHTLAGLVVGEIIHRLLPIEKTTTSNTNSNADQKDSRSSQYQLDFGTSQDLRHKLILTICAIASNFPDLDIVLSPLLPSPLGYLLHHRGHTHTLLYAVPQGIFLCALFLALWPAARGLAVKSPATKIGIALATTIGFSLHLLMDSLNSYGIHPFYPFISRWFYGDLVFIVEPYFWVAWGVPLALSLRSIRIKSILLLLLLGASIFFATAQFILWTSFAALLAITAFMFMIQNKSRLSTFIGAVLLSVLFVLTQALAATKARQMISAAIVTNSILDISLTAYPINPICWSFASIEIAATHDTYQIHKGIISILPKLLPVEDCPQGLRKMQANQPSQANQFGQIEVFRDLGEFRNPGELEKKSVLFFEEKTADLNLLRQLSDHNCYLKAWLRFARIPFITEEMASDLRFSSANRTNFSDLPLNMATQTECPRHVPKWEFPRADLLHASRLNN